MAALGRPRSLMHVVRNIDRDARLPKDGKAPVLSLNALRTLVAYSLSIERGKAELVRLGLVHLVPASQCPRASKAGVHHSIRVARLNRRGIEALPSAVVPSGAEGRPVWRAGLSRLEGVAPPHVEDQKKEEEEEKGGGKDHDPSSNDLNPAWAVADAVAHELDRPAPSRGDKSERSLAKLRADARAASAQHWQAALRARLRAFYEQSDPWLAKNRWPLGSALQVEQPQLRVQTYGGEIVEGKRGRVRIVRIGREVVAREFIADAQEQPASAEEATECVTRISALLGP